MDSVSFWKTKKGKALKKLLIWCIFFLIVFVFIKLSNTNKDNKSDKQNETVSKTIANYKDAMTELKSGSIDYTYNILDGENEYVLTGHRTGDIDSGTIQVGEETMDYNIDADGFQLMTDDEENDKTITFNMDYLNYKFIDTLIDNKPVMIDSGFEYPGDDVTYIFNCDGNHVSSILITSSNYIYDMHINNIMPN